MGYAYCGTDSNGRDIGYGIRATCDHPGCEEEIDRGMAYVCGHFHGDDEYSCEKYFCEEHRQNLSDRGRGMICDECKELEEEFLQNQIEA